MVFNSSSFVYFFAIVYVVYWSLARYRSGQRWQNRFLLVASYFFYGWWDWIFLGLIFLSTITDYLVALGIQNAPQANRRRRGLLLFISVAVNIGLLATFKYYDFFVTSFVGMVRMFQPDAFGDGSEWLLLNVLLPVGISFYTFQTLSYTIDVYRGIIPAERNFWDFSLYVSFFPQLVAGPIERAGDLLPQLKARREFKWSDLEAGLWFVLLGFFLKTYVADSLAPLVDQVYLSGKGVYGQMPALAANHGGAQVLIASVAFAFQIYGDFAGYSTIAMGAARLMGIRLTLNFDTPEFSQNPAELWRRWHSTLNRWLRDYVYIPLGGSKLGPFAKYFNLFMVFLLTGLWHGANWTFVLWGAWMGAWIIGHQLLLPYLPKLPENTSKSIVIPVRALKMIGVYGCFGLSATLFRAYDIEHSYLLWQSMLDFPWNLSDSIMNVPAAGPFFIEFLQKIIILLLIDFAWYRSNDPLWIFKRSLPVRVMVYALLFFCIIILGVFGKDVIYFAF